MVAVIAYVRLTYEVARLRIRVRGLERELARARDENARMRAT